MKRAALAVAAGFWFSDAGLAAGLTVDELEALVLSGEITPEAAILNYCSGETLSMTQDAFCACPEDALRLLQQRLKARGMVAG